jgi:hypothetical protein
MGWNGKLTINSVPGEGSDFDLSSGVMVLEFQINFELINHCCPVKIKFQIKWPFSLHEVCF